MATKKAISSTKKSTTTTSSAQTNVTMASVVEAIKGMPLVGLLVAEFVGAFLLTASFIEMQANPLFVGLALVGVVLIVGGVSGSHVNPAITIGAWVTRKMNWLNAAGYIVAQLLGATVAYLVLTSFVNANSLTEVQKMSGAQAPTLFHAASTLTSGVGKETLAEGKLWYVFFAELLGTGILALGVATSLRMRKNKIVASFVAGLALIIALYIGMSLTSSLLAEANVTLTFLNPAVAFAANGLDWKLWPLAIYVLAPVLGAVIGFVLQDILHSQSDDCDCAECKE